jgi:hypothetical protein
MDELEKILEFVATELNLIEVLTEINNIEAKHLDELDDFAEKNLTVLEEESL